VSFLAVRSIVGAACFPCAGFHNGGAAVPIALPKIELPWCNSNFVGRIRAPANGESLFLMDICVMADFSLQTLTTRPARPPLSPQESARYSRHLIMPEVGMEGQKRLKAGRVLLIGAGGLGSPLGLYLAAAGVGRIGLVDFDVVDFSN